MNKPTQHTLEEDFAHFLAYSGLSDASEEDKAKYRKGFEAAWQPSQATWNARELSLLSLASRRLMVDAYSNANAAAQDKEGRYFKNGSAESFLRDAEDSGGILMKIDAMRSST